jgi:hypothetical protein
MASGDLSYAGFEPITVLASGDINRGFALELSSIANDGITVKAATLDTTFAIGIALTDAASGEAFRMAPIGPVVTMYGTATAGAQVTVDGDGTDGQVKDAESGDEICGVALEAATASEFRAMLGAGGRLKA